MNTEWLDSQLGRENQGRYLHMRHLANPLYMPTPLLTVTTYTTPAPHLYVLIMPHHIQLLLSPVPYTLPMYMPYTYLAQHQHACHMHSHPHQFTDGGVCRV